MNNEIDGLALFLKPKLKLFLSVDLVGSTALKQAGHFPIEVPKENDGLKDTRAQWFSEVANFYREMERHFSDFWMSQSKISKDVKWDISEAPKLWKSNGDELIYVMDIVTPIDAFFAITCWMKAFKKYRDHLHKSKNKKLDVKASAWVAGFPVANSEIVFRPSISSNAKQTDSGDLTYEHFDLLNQWYEEKKNGGASGLIIDYIGPSIDTGFRIASLASPRKFTLSLETALILSFVRPPEQFDDLVFMYGGRELLKGVLGGKPYPVFWIDTHLNNNLSQLEDKLASPQPQCADDVRKFCVEFIKQYENYVFMPFMLEGKEESLSTPPENYWLHLLHMNTKWKSENEKYTNEKKALANAEPEDDAKNTHDDVDFLIEIDL